MDGDKLLEEITHRIMKRKRTKTVSDAALAKELGITQPALANYRGKKVTARQVVNLMEKFAREAERQLVNDSVMPVVEFFPLKPKEMNQGKNWQIFSTNDNGGQSHPYLVGLRKILEQAHGIYVFHDSRGRAIYAGKAQKQPLWTEINKAFNRDRGEVQNLKRVDHPTSRIPYKTNDERQRQIKKSDVALHQIASYVSAYEVSDGLIGKFESLIVRSFANDLLNVRMENF